MKFCWEFGMDTKYSALPSYRLYWNAHIYHLSLFFPMFVKVPWLSHSALFMKYLSPSSIFYSGELMYMQVQGVVQDRSGRTVATLFGKWDESMHYVMGDCFGKGKGSENFSEAHLLWKRSKPPKFPTRYNFTRFAITLNELTAGLKVNILMVATSYHIHFILRSD